jgi:exodeoxyribonuclease-5
MRPDLTEEFNTLIVDECSMIDEELYQDIKKCGLRILLVGDPHQLPPVAKNGKLAVAPFNAEKPHIVLTKVHRTDRPEILDLAGMLQRGERPTYRKTESLEVIGNTMLARADQVICGLNRTRVRLNAEVRKLKGYTSPVPVVGERLVALRTYRRANHAVTQQASEIAKAISSLEKSEGRAALTVEGARELSRLRRLLDKLERPRHIANGSLWSVVAIVRHEPPYIVMTLRASDLGNDGEDEFQIEAKVHYHLFDPDIRKQNNLNYQAMHHDKAMHFEFAYAITCHKAQGSEYDRVLVVDQARHVMRTLEGIRQWRYTAATRAKQLLIWVTSDADPW